MSVLCEWAHKGLLEVLKAYGRSVFNESLKKLVTNSLLGIINFLSLNQFEERGFQHVLIIECRVCLFFCEI